MKIPMRLFGVLGAMFLTAFCIHLFANVTTTAQTLSDPPYWGLLKNLTWLHGMFGISGTLIGTLLANYRSVWAWITSTQGQKTLSDSLDILEDVADAAAANNHPLAPQVVTDAKALTAKIQAMSGTTTPPTPGAKLGAFLIFLGLAILAGHVRADITLSQNAGTGASVYSVVPGGGVHATGAAAVTYGLTMAYVGVTGTATPSTDNLVVVSTGPIWDKPQGSVDGYIGWYLMAGSQVPATPVNFMVGGYGNFFTGVSNPFGVIACVSFPIGNVWKTWKD